MGCCFGEANWKREEIADHKFDYIDVEDFVEDDFWRRIQYSFVFLATLKSILVYMADVGILVIMGVTGIFDALIKSGKDLDKACKNNQELSSFCDSSKQRDFVLPTIARIIIVCVSIFVSFVLLIFDWRKAKKVIRSRDISYAFTSTIAYRYYAIRSYPHFCFFSQIQNSRKTVDVLAFHVFFVFKDWFRVLIVESPRQFINVINLREVYLSHLDKSTNDSFMVFFNTIGNIYNSYTNGSNTSQLFGVALMIFSLAIWLFTVLNLIIAFLIYIPLLTSIQGNLKEYCVHKIDKRIAELLIRRSKKRREEARKAELAEIERNRLLDESLSEVTLNDGKSATSNKMVAPPLGHKQGPTLPQVNIDLKSDDARYGTVPYGVVSTGMPAYLAQSHAPSDFGSFSDRGHFVPMTTLSTLNSNYAYAIQQHRQNVVPLPPITMQHTTEYSVTSIPLSPIRKEESLEIESTIEDDQEVRLMGYAETLSAYNFSESSTLAPASSTNHCYLQTHHYERAQESTTATMSSNFHSTSLSPPPMVPTPSDKSDSNSATSSGVMSISNFTTRAQRLDQVRAPTPNRVMNGVYRPVPVRAQPRAQSTANESLYSYYQPSIVTDTSQVNNGPDSPGVMSEYGDHSNVPTIDRNFF